MSYVDTSTVRYSEHALARMNQRHIAYAEVASALYAPDEVFVANGSRCGAARLGFVQGTVVVILQGDVVVTAYRRAPQGDGQLEVTR